MSINAGRKNIYAPYCPHISGGSPYMDHTVHIFLVWSPIPDPYPKIQSQTCIKSISPKPNPKPIFSRKLIPNLYPQNLNPHLYPRNPNPNLQPQKPNPKPIAQEPQPKPISPKPKPKPISQKPNSKPITPKPNPKPVSHMTQSQI